VKISNRKTVVKVIKEQRPKSNKYRNVPYYIALVALLVIVLFSFMYSLFHISGDGFLRSKEAIIGSPVFGKVEDVYVKIGDNVTKNSIVAVIRDYNGNVTYIRSPMNGEVVDLFKREYETVTRGASLLTVADRSNQYFLVFFNPKEYNYIVEGTVVSIHARDGKVFKGTVEKVNPVIYPLSSPDNYHGDIRMFFSAKVVTHEKIPVSYPYDMRVKVYMRR